MIVAARRILSAAALILPLLVAAPAVATVQRTFVSAAGSDAGACSLGAPCRSFLAALSRTNSGGEIVVLDSGGYGSVTITQAVTIAAPEGVYAGISVFAGDSGVTVDAPFAVVVLRGLTINGQGGTSGINFVQGAELRVVRCHISSMTDSGIVAQLGNGSVLQVANTVIARNINAGIRASGAGRISLANVHIAGNGGFGFLVQDGPDVAMRDAIVEQNNWGIGAFANTADTLLEIRNSRIFSNNKHGIWAQTTGAGTNVVSINVSDSAIERNNQSASIPSGGIYAQANLATSIRTTITRTQLNHNQGAGLYLQLQFPNGAATATSYVTQSVAVGNTGFGLTTVGAATIYTLGNNTVQENAGGDLNGNIVAYPGPN
jgi:hypothetical protein